MYAETDHLFAAEYRRHAANCFHMVGAGRILDGCVPGGPPLHGCNVGEALHRLATRKLDPVPSGVLTYLMVR